MAGNSSELWRAVWMPLACIAGMCPIAAGRDRNGERGIRVCSCPQLCLCLQKSLHWNKIPGFFSLPSHRLSVQPCLDVSDLWAYSPLVKMGLTRLSKLLWNTGMSLLSECAEQHYCVSSDLSVWNFAKGRGKEATVDSSPAQRSCKQMVFAYRIFCSGATPLQRSSFLMIAGGLNSGYIWNS